jgi:hypothetical protein
MAAIRRSAFIPLFAGVVIVQGMHVGEHIIQLIQVYALGVPDDDALGLLGTVFQFQDTEEWLHLVFNVSYLGALYLLLVPLWRLVPGRLPAWAFVSFVVWSVGLESWHVVEHLVIIANVLRNHGCPCPGIGDRVLGVTDTVLHFGYNLVAFLGLLVPFAFVTRWRHRAGVAMGTPTTG